MISSTELTHFMSQIFNFLPMRIIGPTESSYQKMIITSVWLFRIWRIWSLCRILFCTLTMRLNLFLSSPPEAAKLIFQFFSKICIWMWCLQQEDWTLDKVVKISYSYLFFPHKTDHRPYPRNYLPYIFQEKLLLQKWQRVK